MHSKILDELCNLILQRTTVIAERIVDGDKVYITDPVLEIPRQSPSKNHHYIVHNIPIALSYELCPMNPRVSMVEF